MTSLAKLITILLFLFSCVANNSIAQSISSLDTTSEHSIRGTFYHDRFVGRKTSSGEVFRQDRYTAAHRYLKFGTLLLVTNPKNGKQVIVRINDRCPKDRILDMTRLAASTIEVKSSTVIIRVLPPRFSELWERQEQLLDILSKGQLLDYAANFFANHKPNHTSSTPEKSAKHPATDNNLLYDIDLQQNSTVTQEKVISQLPLYLQDKVGLRSLHGNSSRSLVIFLSLPLNEATKILTSLQPKFPNATLVASD